MTKKELGYVELEWTCKHCNTINPGMNRVCSNCGAPIAKDDKFELPDQQELITDQEKLEEAKKGPAIQCPYCNVLNPAGTKICIQCGGDIEAGLARQAGQVLGAFETSAVPDKPCPFCNQPVKANAQRCPHCGGSLVEALSPSAIATGASKKTPIWLIIGGIAIGVIFIALIIGVIIKGSQTRQVTASVTDIRWQRSIKILALQAVKSSAWSDELPTDAQNVSCQDEYKETSDQPVPNATEECGTPYTIDVGSGAGKVVQDCVYRVFASYCDFTVQQLVVVDSAVALGSDTNPYWPGVSLQTGQQVGDRLEIYRITFNAGGKSYVYTPADVAEFSQIVIGSRWILDVNAFGNIRGIRAP